jgi:AraC-like DNA-binding protein
MARIEDPGKGANPPAVRAIAGGEAWSVSEVVCVAGPDDSPYEERHHGFSVSAVLEGVFTYRGERGASLLYPGAILLGNSGACYECGHRHSVGDRCVSFNLSEDAFEEIVGTRRFRRFTQPMLPASDKLTPLFAVIEGLRSGASPLRAEELAIGVVETAVGALNDGAPAPPAPASWEARRVIEVLRHIEKQADEPLDLGGMAAMAGLSRHHFLRSFRRLVGMTPYRYLLRVRMARAARRLAATRDPVIAIALEAGFGDVSTFNARFRAIFGTTPSNFRGASA